MVDIETCKASESIQKIPGSFFSSVGLAPVFVGLRLIDVLAVFEDEIVDFGVDVEYSVV